MFKYLIAKIKLKKAQKRCYKAHKKAGLTYFNGMCKGHYEKINGMKFPSKRCAACPYFRGVK